MDDLISRQAAINCVSYDEEWTIERLKALPSAQPEQSIAQERYEDLCEYFKGCSNQGRSILNDRKEFKSWLDRMKWHVMECNKLGRELEKLKSAQPEPCADTVSRTAAIEAQERIMSDHPLDGYEDGRLLINALKALPSAQPNIAEKLYQYKCYITDEEGLQHEVIHTGDIRRVTGWEI